MKQQSLTEGSVAKGLFFFILPLMLGQLLQQLYNVADAWVIGNFADNASFAAVSSGGNLAFLIVGFFNGISVGAGVIIAWYFGAKKEEELKKAIHTTVLFGIITSILVTFLTLRLIPWILVLMKTPETVLPLSLGYFHIYCAGISTIIMYNVFMAIMRALGDSLSPLIYLCISSITNIILDLIFVAVMHKGVYGAALATVIAQGLSAVLCYIQMQRSSGYMHIYLKELRIDFSMLRQIIAQGLPAGIQNSALSLGNVVVQSHVNSFGQYAMAGMGSHAKVEGFVFIPVIAIAMSISTYVSQNRAAGKMDRVKKGIIYSLGSSMFIAQFIGIFMFFFAPKFLGIFTNHPESVSYGVMFTRRLTLFYTALAFSHGASGVLQGYGKSIIPMITMMSIWCGIRILYVTIALQIRPVFTTICWAYPLTWTLSTTVFIVILTYILRRDSRVAE